MNAIRSAIVAAVIRHMLTAVGGVALANAVSNSDLSSLFSSVQTIAGAASVVVGIVWSIYHKYQLAKDEAASLAAASRTKR